MCSKCQPDDATEDDDRSHLSPEYARLRRVEDAAVALAAVLYPPTGAVATANPELERLRRIEASAKRVIDAVFDDDAPNLREQLDALARALAS